MNQEIYNLEIGKELKADVTETKDGQRQDQAHSLSLRNISTTGFYHHVHEFFFTQSIINEGAPGKTGEAKTLLLK